MRGLADAFFRREGDGTGRLVLRLGALLKRELIVWRRLPFVVVSVSVRSGKKELG